MVYNIHNLKISQLVKWHHLIAEENWTIHNAMMCIAKHMFTWCESLFLDHCEWEHVTLESLAINGISPVHITGSQSQVIDNSNPIIRQVIFYILLSFNQFVCLLLIQLLSCSTWEQMTVLLQSIWLYTFKRFWVTLEMAFCDFSLLKSHK